MNNFVCLDLGTQTGYAKYDDGKIDSGSKDFSTKRFEGGGFRGLRFRDFLNTLTEQRKPQAIYFEEVRAHMGTLAAHVYGGLLMVLTMWCEEHEVPYLSVPVQHIKTAVTGNHMAKKEEVIAAVKRLGHNPKDDNEADAIALMYHVIRKLDEGTLLL